jgi:membrane-associated phospholipid phosphatase
MRGVGVTEWLVDLVPTGGVPVLLALTFLGDPVFLAALAPLAYWFGPRLGVIERANGARFLAVTLGALALTILLKYGFALPRPPDTVMLVPEDGFGFPSGHATGSAAVYGGFAALAHWQTRTTRWLYAGSLVLLVALTRLLLGVHYLVDVVVGMALGLLFAWLLVALTRTGIRHGFRAATLLALATPLVAGATTNTAAAIGGAVGALLAWELRGAQLLDRHRDVSLPLALGGLVVFGGLAGVAYVLEPSLPLVLAANTVASAGFVGLPLAQNFSR